MRIGESRTWQIRVPTPILQQIWIQMIKTKGSFILKTLSFYFSFQFKKKSYCQFFNVLVLHLQLEMGQSAGLAVSDSSDKSKEKPLDQKVIIIYTFFPNVIGVIKFTIGLLIPFLWYNNLQTLRRLAQNREAARKSRLRKKVGFGVYINSNSSPYLVF